MTLEPRRYRAAGRARTLEAWIAGEGPPLVLLHGWGLSGAAYRAALRAIAARGRRAIAPSLAAVGAPWSLPTVAALAAESLDAFEVERAPVAGHSFGGVAGVRLAVDAPEMVSALVLANAPVLNAGTRRLARLVLPGSHVRIAAHAGTLTALAGTLARGGARDLAGSARWVLGRDCADELEGLRARALPTTVLWAENDTLLPRDVGARTAALLGVKLEIVRGGNGWPAKRPPDHDWPMRGPGVFARRVLRAVARSSIEAG